MKILTTKTNQKLLQLARDLHQKLQYIPKCNMPRNCGQGALCESCELRDLMFQIIKLIDRDNKIL